MPKPTHYPTGASADRLLAVMLSSDGKVQVLKNVYDAAVGQWPAPPVSFSNQVVLAAGTSADFEVEIDPNYEGTSSVELSPWPDDYGSEDSIALGFITTSDPSELPQGVKNPLGKRDRKLICSFRHGVLTRKGSPMLEGKPNAKGWPMNVSTYDLRPMAKPGFAPMCYLTLRVRGANTGKITFSNVTFAGGVSTFTV